MDYDRTNIPATYSRARDHGPAFLEQWMKVLGGSVNANVTRTVLDLGCGTGRFSLALAKQFNAEVIGIDPSIRMLSEALAKSARERVLYAAGAAEALPLFAESVDMVFISMVFHHFTDREMVACECCRVLRKDGRLCLRTACSDRISDYPYVPFFPASRPLLEQRLPSLEEQCHVFERAGFQTLSIQLVIQQVAADYAEYADKLALKGDSIIASLGDSDFNAGMAALCSAAAATPPRPVTEPIDFVVFSKG